jgi:hypothetical protein
VQLNSRSIAAGTILLGWSLGVVAFARREMGRTTADRMAEIALRVAPGATYYAAERNGQHVGFSSTTVDTLAKTLQITEYQVADVPQAGSTRRVTKQTVLRLTRGLALRDFTVTTVRDSAPSRVFGWMVDDSTLAVTMVATGAARDTQQVKVPAGIVLPLMIPMAVALGAELKIGARHVVETFDPVGRSLHTVRAEILAESSFVIPDSAVYDAGRAKWTAARMDTVTGWHMKIVGNAESDIWIDELGHPLGWQTPDGLTMRRTAYELAFENWRMVHPGARAADSAAHGNVLGMSAIRANVPPPITDRSRFRVQLSGTPLDAFDLTRWGQSLSGDTLTIERASSRVLIPSFVLPPNDQMRQRFASSLGSAPLLEVNAPAISHMAGRLTRGEPNPVRAVQRILAWMHDSLERAPNDGPAGALRLLRERRGDADAHAQLFVALARASGVPARTVVGVFSIAGRHFPHAWAEVWIQGWVPVDPAFHQFPASPMHIRFLVDGVGALDDFMRATDRLRVNVLASPPEPGTSVHD